MPEQILQITFIIALIFSGGVAAAYVFFDLLPAIQEAAGHLRFLLRGSLDEIPLSEVAIFGVIDSVAASNGIFVIHFSILSLLSLLIAYNLRFEVQTGLLQAVLLLLL